MKKKEDIKVSIITVCFNSVKTIEKTLNSMLVQTYQHYEYLIIDGNSKDATIEIVNKYKPLFGDKLILLSELDNGIYDAMNKGIKMSSGKLIGIVNSDDFYNEDALEIMVKAYNPSVKHQVLYGYQRCLNDGKEEKIVIFNHNFLDKQMITHPTCFVSREVYKDFGLFNLKYKSSADYEFMLRLFYDSAVVFIPVYKVITSFEYGGMSSSEVCVRETASLHLNYKTISFGRYVQIMFQSYLHNIFKK